jgi:hypothetical protein
LFEKLSLESFATDDEQDSWNNLFSFARVPKEIEGANIIFLLKI